MSAKSAAEAVSAFVALIQRVVDCITQDVVHVSAGGYQPAGQPHTVLLNRGRPSRLGGTPPVLFDLTVRYQIVPTGGGRNVWAIKTVEYIYSLRDQADREFLAYHWHPTEGSRMQSPHLHIRDTALSRGSPLGKAHIATGPVRLEDVTQMSVDEFGVRPRKAAWRQTLAESRMASADLLR